MNEWLNENVAHQSVSQATFSHNCCFFACEERNFFKYFSSKFFLPTFFAAFLVFLFCLCWRQQRYIIGVSFWFTSAFFFAINFFLLRCAFCLFFLFILPSCMTTSTQIEIWSFCCYFPSMTLFGFPLNWKICKVCFVLIWVNP